jgi:hypothetical protein
MRPVLLLALLRLRPFRVFRLWLTNGQTHEVRHPELVAVGQTVMRIIYPASAAGDQQGNRNCFIALQHIAQFEFLSPGR